MKRLLTSISIALASTTLAAAAPVLAESAPAPVAATSSPDSMKLAREFVAMTSGPGDIMDELGFNAWPAAAAAIEDKAERAAAEKYMRRLSDRIEPKVRLLMPALQEAYAAAYAREFSADELQQLILFARSPAGKHYMSLTSAVEGDEALVEAQERMWEEITPVLEETRKEFCAEKAALRIAAGDTKAECPLSEPETGQG